MKRQLIGGFIGWRIKKELQGCICSASHVQNQRHEYHQNLARELEHVRVELQHRYMVKASRREPTLIRSRPHITIYPSSPLGSPNSGLAAISRAISATPKPIIRRIVPLMAPSLAMTHSMAKDMATKEAEP